MMLLNPYRFAAPGGGGSAHRYWRWIDVTIPGSYFEISELRVVNGSSPLAATMSSSVDTQMWPGTQHLLADDSTSTRAYWTKAQAEDPGFWVMADLGSAQEVTGMQMVGFDTTDRFPSSITLQYADSGTGPWTTFGTWSGLTYPGNYTAGPVLTP